MVEVPRIVVAGTHSGVGKTTIASGLMAALRAKGHELAPFKVGPDFIDPSYHTLAAGRPGRNLDAFLSGPELIGSLFAHGASGVDVAVVEGVMGLFDGKSGGGEYASTAHVAKLLRAPVLLVVDAGAMARSAAAIVHGYATFDPELRVAGVILNRVGSPTHERMLREAIEPLGIPILGVLRRDANLNTPDRHLGLVPAAERREEARKALDHTGEAIARSCDLEGILRLAASAEPLHSKPWEPLSPETETTKMARLVRVAVASGPAFSFVYRENLELLRGAGAETVFFDPTTEEDLPEDTDALYLGGGFPETYAETLSENEPLREKVRGFALSGRPVAAECGGLLYLCRELDGKKMCGVLDTGARMTDQLSLGYRKAHSLADSPLARRGDTLRGHEFHYSAVEPQAGASPDASPAWELSGRGEEGFVLGGVHASYLHTHWAATPEVPRRFVRNAAQSKPGLRVASHSAGAPA
ncbi:MAG: Cobyrinic acid a,c-diamide synthetase [uncultured Rubrobacteraceae bacterium]|uniref:Hydrogenobyrinate a,c-diamide synthase n=1 Tax=uncultured Rubrobacteraceae bacterium TaxID=349277 RepID=A0A6J4QF41_9ACTN|nr:MAG: Cobyrinic acid a,c-diamide synthetase [uncultured Rubrobacteraceae bacterium]